MCDKVTYTDRDAAAAAINALQKDRNRRHSRNQPSSTYYCEECKGWHVTSKRRRVRKLYKMEINSKPVDRNKQKDGVLRIKNYAHF
jgi:uncharacterized protein YlaI